MKRTPFISLWWSTTWSPPDQTGPTGPRSGAPSRVVPSLRAASLAVTSRGAVLAWSWSLRWLDSSEESTSSRVLRPRAALALPALPPGRQARTALRGEPRGAAGPAAGACGAASALLEKQRSAPHRAVLSRASPGGPPRFAAVSPRGPSGPAPLSSEPHHGCVAAPRASRARDTSLRTLGSWQPRLVAAARH